MAINLDGILGVSTTGNVTGNYILGNGSQLTGINAGNANAIFSGNSSVSIDANGNAVVNINNANIASFTPAGLELTGNLIPTANIAYTLGNATNQWKDLWVSNATIYMNSIPINLTQATLSNGAVVDTLAVSSWPVIVQQEANAQLGNLTVASNISAPNIAATSFNWSNGVPVISNTGNLDITTISATGNITGDILNANGANISGDIYFANGYATGEVSAIGNVTGGNLLTVGDVSATGNVTGAYLLGNGYYITGLPASYSNVEVAAYLANANTTGDIYAGNISAYGNIATDGTLTTAGNATVGGFLNVQAITGGAMQISATGTLQDISLSATGNISVNSTYINSVTDPIQAQDAATKYYVDASAQGLAVKNPVVVATTTTLPSYTYNNGTSGVGATITADAVGNLTIDGVLVATNDRVLIKDESGANAPYNGIYDVTTAGAVGTAFVLTRTVDNNSQAEIVGALVYVDQGTTNGATSWFDTNNPPITVGTTDITWVQFSSSGVSAGNGLSQSGHSINVNTDGVTTEINGSNQVAVKASANLVTPNIGNAVGNSLTLTGSGNISTTGTITTAYANVAGNVVTGNILTNNYLYANGAPLSFNTSGINNGTSNVDIPVANSAIVFTVGGNYAGAIGANVILLGDVTGANGLYANPVRNDLSNVANVVYYNATTKELTYAPAAQTYGNANVALYLANATTSGDIYGGNIRANGIISATGNISVGNNLTVTANATVSGTSSTTGNITGGANLTIAGNITAGNLSLGTGNIIAGNIDASYFTTPLGTNGNITIDPDGTGVFVITPRTPSYFANTANSTSTTTGAVTFAGGVGIAGNLNVGGNFAANNTNFTNITVSNSGNIGNLTVPGQTTLTGNATTGNIATTGIISATANVTGGNILTSGLVSATGNATAGNVLTSGVVQATGNVSGGNLFTSGTAFATGNVTGANVNTAGTANVGTLAVQGNATVALNATITGNTTSGNLLTAGIVSAGGNVTGANLLTAGQVSATGNVSGNNINATGNANISGNVVADYVFAAHDIIATGNVDGLNVNTSNVYGNSIDITATATNADISLNTNGTGNIVLNSTYINGVLNPVQAQDAATKGYVDSVATGLQVKASSNVATTTGLPAYVYNNGTFGVGATITGNVNGALVIDTVTVNTGDRVLVKDETSTNAPYNGIYDVTIPGDAGNAYVLTRSSDDDTPADMYAAYTFINSGATNGTTSWTCTAVATSPINIGFDAITWVQFSSSAQYTNGNGLALNGTVFSVNVDNNTTAISGANVVVKAGANLTTPNIGNATGNSLTLTGSGNITGGNLAMSGIATVTGNTTVGNLSTAGQVSAVGNATAGNLLTSGEVSATGNATAGNLSTAGTLYVGGESTQAGNVSVLSQIFVGPTANTTTLTGPVIYAQGAANAFSQIGLINVNGNSSADMITYANNGTDSTGYADMGMTGNTYNDLNYTITAPNDGYFFVQGTTDGGGNLVIATGDQGNTHDIVFATGGFLAPNEKLRLVDAANTLQPYANLTLDLGSNTNYFGNVYANNLSLAQNFTANNITAVNNISGLNLTVTGITNSGDTTLTGNLTVTGNSSVSGDSSTTGNVVAGNVSAALGNVIANAVNSNSLTINGTTNLGVLGNITILGGANGQAIITDGNGVLSWGNAGSGGSGNLAAIPAVYFTSVANANNQSFSNVALGGYANAEAMTVFYNGALLENNLYTLSGDTITINTPLVVGDNIDIPTQFGGNFTYVTSGYGNSNVAAFFTSYAGDIIPAADNGYNLGNASLKWGNVFSYNVLANVVSASGNITGANITGTGITGTSLSTSGNVTGGNIRTAGTISSTGNVNAGGMIISGNAVITGNALVQGTLTYNNTTSITTSNLVLGLGNTQTGVNVNGGGLVVGNTNEAQFLYSFSTQSWVSNIGITSNANVTGGNIRTAGSVSATGNVTGNYVLGNGALLTGVVTSTASISNGASNVNIATSSGNITVGVNSVSNVVVVTPNSLSVAGNVYDSTGQLYGVAASVAKYTRTTDQTGIASNSVVICNVAENTFGVDIAVDTTTGNITLQPNKTYRLRGQVGYCNLSSGGSAALTYQWFNVTGNAWVGQGAGINAAADSSGDAWNQDTAEYVFTPSVTTVVQLKVVGAINTNSILVKNGSNYTTNWKIGAPYIDIEVIGGQAPLLNQAQYGTAVINLVDGATISSNFATPTNLMTFNIPSAGTWEITPTISYGTLASSSAFYALYSGATPTSSNIVTGTVNYLVSLSGGTGIGGSTSTTYTVVTSGPATYTIGAYLNAGTVVTYNGSIGQSRGVYNQIGGLAPATGQPNWTLAGTIQSVGLSATTTAPVFPTGTFARNAVRYKQIGAKTWQVQVTLNATGLSGGTTGSGDYLFTLPNNLQFDTTVQPLYTLNVGQANTWDYLNWQIPGNQVFMNGNGTAITYNNGGIIPYSNTQYRVCLPLIGSGVNCWGSNWYQFTGFANYSTNWTFTFQAL